MSLNYTSNKNILIEAKESCRVPVPVERCPLDRILNEVNNQQVSDTPQSEFNILINYKYVFIMICDFSKHYEWWWT